MSAPLRLSREVRFGLHESVPPAAPGQANGFAGNPALLGLDPFLTLTATIAGQVDPQTGMLVNIKDIDTLLRRHAIPLLREHYHRDSPADRQAAGLLPTLFDTCTRALAPHHLDSLRLALSPYLHLTIQAKEKPMVRLSLRFEFSASHRLHADALSPEQNRALFGRCNNPNGHGHNYELEVTIAGEPDAAGQIIPIPALQQIVNTHIIDPFDHKHLNLDCPDFQRQNPTVENIAAVLYHRLKSHIPAPARLASLKVWETPKTMCEFSA